MAYRGTALKISTALSIAVSLATPLHRGRAHARVVALDADQIEWPPAPTGGSDPCDPPFLLRDRDTKFCRSFDDVFRSEDAEIIRTPVQAPTANAYAERWVGTVRAECLDWLLIMGRGHLEQVLRVYVQHYNRHRPHRALGLQAPDSPAELIADKGRPRSVSRRDLLGGLVHQYRRAA